MYGADHTYPAGRRYSENDSDASAKSVDLVGKYGSDPVGDRDGTVLFSAGDGSLYGGKAFSDGTAVCDRQRMRHDSAGIYRADGKRGESDLCRDPGNLCDLCIQRHSGHSSGLLYVKDYDIPEAIYQRKPAAVFPGGMRDLSHRSSGDSGDPAGGQSFERMAGRWIEYVAVTCTGCRMGDPRGTDYISGIDGDALDLYHHCDHADRADRG